MTTRPGPASRGPPTVCSGAIWGPASGVGGASAQALLTVLPSGRVVGGGPGTAVLGGGWPGLGLAGGAVTRVGVVPAGHVVSRGPGGAGLASGGDGVAPGAGGGVLSVPSADAGPVPRASAARQTSTALARRAGRAGGLTRAPAGAVEG
ncbi:MAG: hypothetical protein ACR2JN_06920 [Lapillicoccus sp.]